jgi:hypothetical protein
MLLKYMVFQSLQKPEKKTTLKNYHKSYKIFDLCNLNWGRYLD